MSSILGGLEGVATNAAGEAIAFGLGFALGRALEPAGVTIQQDAWKADPIKAVDPLTAAAIVAEDVQQLDWGEQEAVASGIDTARFQAILGEVLEAPAFGELVRMLRRGTISTDDFVHGLRKAKLETRWDTALEELQTERLDPAVVATSIQRGIIADPGLLPVDAPTGGGVVPPMPVAQIDALTEAAAAGIDKERLAAMTRIVGLPPAPGELLQLVNRGVIEQDDFYRGVAEGNTRNEWGPFLLKLQRRLLSPHEYAELNLRGWIDTSARDAGAALSGMEPADTQLLFNMLGRPLSVHAVTIGEARGGVFGGTYANVPEPYLTAARQSNVRPEWGNLWYAGRYTLPSAFFFRLLLQNGSLSADDGEKWFLQLGWPPELAKEIAQALATTKTGTADAHVGKAQTQVWSTLHKSYLESLTTADEAPAYLDAIGVAAEAQGPIIDLWDKEREIIRKTLTPAQIKKAYGEQKFTIDVATQLLERQGYDAVDAATFLAE